MTFPWITAHSGSMNTPDNSLLSVRSGLESGADIVEEDLRATKDGIPVLAHEDELQTADRGVCLVSRSTFAELRDAEIVPHGGGTAFRIVRLDEVLPIIKRSGKRINLDLKELDVIEPMAHLIRKEEMAEQVILSGCEMEKALYAQNKCPELKHLLNVDAPPFLKHDYAAAVQMTCNDALAAGCFGLNIHYRLCKRELVEHAAGCGLPVMVWTVSHPDEMRRFAGMGVRSITTRDVAQLMKVKREFSAP